MTAKTSASGGRRRRLDDLGEEGRPMVPRSLVAQAFAILKEKICLGEYVRVLPSERVMCETLVVSRGTLRKALARLAGEGWVRNRQGRRWEIIEARRKALSQPPRRVALLTPVSLSGVAPFESYWIDSLRAHLQDAGYRLEVYQNLDYRNWRYQKVLEEMLRELRPAGWVLRSAPAGVQQWFSEHSQPCVIVGSRHAAVALPSLDRDLPAVCRHAVGQLVRKGHTRLVLLIPESGLAGDLACEHAFREATERMLRGGEASAVIAHHRGTREDIFRRLAAVMTRRPAPTGFLVADTRYTLGAISFFQRQGLRLPGDVSLIARDNDHFLEYVSPTVARYATDPSLFALRMARMVLRLVEGDNLQSRDYRVVPRFIPGETLG